MTSCGLGKTSERPRPARTPPDSSADDKRKSERFCGVVGGVVEIVGRGEDEVEREDFEGGVALLTKSGRAGVLLRACGVLRKSEDIVE